MKTTVDHEIDPNRSLEVQLAEIEEWELARQDSLKQKKAQHKEVKPKTMEKIRVKTATGFQMTVEVTPEEINEIAELVKGGMDRNLAIEKVLLQENQGTWL
jgi:hypothetical protein